MDLFEIDSLCCFEEAICRKNGCSFGAQQTEKNIDVQSCLLMEKDFKPEVASSQLQEMNASWKHLRA